MQIDYITSTKSWNKCRYEIYLLHHHTHINHTHVNINDIHLTTFSQTHMDVWNQWKIYQCRITQVSISQEICTHSAWFGLLICDYTTRTYRVHMMYLPILLNVATLSMGQSYNYPIASEVNFKFKNILFGINTKSHTLTNGESETQQGFIWLNAHNYIVR